MQEKIYLDNAATTKLSEEVLITMMPYLTSQYGNPSSAHAPGREARMAVENARKKIAQLLNVRPAEIIFTSCGTESNNTAFHAAVNDLGCRQIITSQVEHHAVLHTAEKYKKAGIPVHYAPLTENGHIDLEGFFKLLEETGRNTFVSLMHANNEIGNRTDIEELGRVCAGNEAIFHSDCVQTIGHYPVDFQKIKVHFASASAHKFHGPKGIGFLFVREKTKFTSYITGGSQERNLRAGTENVAYIVGMAKALELALENHDREAAQIGAVKTMMREGLRARFEKVLFNGDSIGDSLYTVLNASFPLSDKTEMLLLDLDRAGICASGGSACSSGAGSHVIEALGTGSGRVNVRFSFSRYTTTTEIDKTIRVLEGILQPEKETV
ncbi:MAG: cysteine desulfurase family protein [Chitinophagaceae bacterium]